MRHKGGPRLLVTARESALYLERARIHVEGGRIVYHIEDDELRREFNIPHVNLAVLFMGQGSSITQEAVRLLGEEHVHVAVTGTGGTPLHMGALTTYSSTRHFREMIPIFSDPAKSLAAAKTVMKDRADRMRTFGVKTAKDRLKLRDLSALTNRCQKFEEALLGCNDIPQLLGVEGQFSKGCYEVFARLSGLNEFRRQAGTDEDFDASKADPIRIANRLIDHGNYLCYGMAGAALWALGIPPHMSVFHGKTRAGGLVFDVADSFKDALVLPLAFATASQKKRAETPEKEFRARLISSFNDRAILKESIDTVDRMIASAGLGSEAIHA